MRDYNRHCIADKTAKNEVSSFTKQAFHTRLGDNSQVSMMPASSAEYKGLLIATRCDMPSTCHGESTIVLFELCKNGPFGCLQYQVSLLEEYQARVYYGTSTCVVFVLKQICSRQSERLLPLAHTFGLIFIT